MKRRTMLSTVGVVALAGCLQDGAGGPGGGGTTGPGLIDESFEVTDVSGGTGTQQAAVSFDDGVTIEGTTTGNNGCYTAELAGATFEQGELEVIVEAVEEDGDMCTQQLVEIDYRASFQFEGQLPERVVVNHDSMGKRRTVAQAER